MDYIKGFTYGWLSRRGDFRTEAARQSLRLLKERTGSEYVIFALAALQDTPHTTEVDYTGEHMVDDEELLDMLHYAHSLGLRTILKPTVNCRNGTWRAHINFFDRDVPCEPKWDQWFASYTDYQCHYARIAEQAGCHMTIVGCEMVQTERRSAEWRQLIHHVRQHYSGLISYNTDKYQEANVDWWDAVDVISSSGYYPQHDWEQQLDRIEQIVKPYGKPFFFAEAGCPSRTGSAAIPNDWGWAGATNVEEQAAYYEAMFQHAGGRDWVEGFGLWDWSALLYDEHTANADNGYGVFGKSAERVIRDFYRSIQR